MVPFADHVGGPQSKVGALTRRTELVAIGSEKVSHKPVFTRTSVVPFAGTELISIGGSVSDAAEVVNENEVSPVSRPPAGSFPPMTMTYRVNGSKPCS